MSVSFTAGLRTDPRGRPPPGGLRLHTFMGSIYDFADAVTLFEMMELRSGCAFGGTMVMNGQSEQE